MGSLISILAPFGELTYIAITVGGILSLGLLFLPVAFLVLVHFIEHDGASILKKFGNAFDWASRKLSRQSKRLTRWSERLSNLLRNDQEQEFEYPSPTAMVGRKRAVVSGTFINVYLAVLIATVFYVLLTSRVDSPVTVAVNPNKADKLISQVDRSDFAMRWNNLSYSGKDVNVGGEAIDLSDVRLSPADEIKSGGLSSRRKSRRTK